MKKSIVKLLTIISVVTVSSSSIAMASQVPENRIEARENEEQTSGDWTYKVDGSSVTLTGYKGTGETLDIPEKIDDKTVTKVDVDFSTVSAKFTTIKIPATVEKIANDYGIDGIETFSCKCFNTVNNIQCSNDGHYYTKDSALVYRSSKDSSENVLLFIKRNFNSFNVPDCVTTIAKSSFASVDAPDTQVLDCLQISKGVKNIEYDLFSEAKINNVQVNDQNQDLCLDNNIFYSKDKKTLLKVLSCSDESFTINDSIEKVSSKALANLSSITKVIIEGSSSSKTTLAKNAICLKNLTTIELKSSTIELEGGALTKDNLPSFKNFIFTGSFTDDEKAEFNNALNSGTYEVIFVDDEDKQIGEKQQVKKGEDAKAPEAPAKEGYVFDKWDTDFTKVSRDLKVKAIYKVAPKTYTVKFLDKDGKQIGEDQEVNEGEDAKSPDAPKVEGYEFEKWDTDFTKVSKDLEVKAVYKKAIKEYLVKFLDKDGKQIGDTQKVKEGEDAKSPDAPKVEGYEFEKWDTDFTKVSEDLEVKAVYKKAIKEYLVKFLDKDRKQIGDTQKVKEGEDAKSPDAPKVEGYEFEKWDADFTKVSEDLEVKAVYKKAANEYTVKFLDKDGKQIGDIQKIKEGEAAKAPEAPIVDGYKFEKWNEDFSKITKDLDITAVYKKVYTVKFLDKDGKQIGLKVEVKEGEAVKAPDAPKVEGYEFEKWDTDFSNVSRDLEVKAIYKEVQVVPVINKYTVKFIGQDGKQIGNDQVVEEGKAAIAPEAPNVDGYEFQKWDTDYSKVNSNLEIKAIYNKNSTVTPQPGPANAGDVKGFVGINILVSSALGIFALKKKNNNKIK